MLMVTHDQKAKRDLMFSVDVHSPYLVRRPHGMKINGNDLKVIRQWIKDNQELLINYWNDEISVPDFLKGLKKG